MGAQIVAVSDASGGLFAGDGLPVTELFDHTYEHRTIEGFGQGEALSNEELITLDCDILIPAALGGVITQENANDVRAKMVVEAANSPITTIGDAILNDRGVIVVPDIFANAGGVTVSYFEWVQNIQAMTWEEDDVNQQLERIMVKAYRDVTDVMKQQSVPMRTAAFTIAIQRVADTEKMRGGF
jgi:glutamate dehydrogenase (NAD(P)+)